MNSRSGRPNRSIQPVLWSGPLTVGLTAGLAFVLYWLSCAPNLTWAHQGADGGELIAAAISNGVPHPPGYPLYMLLLRGWLAATDRLLPFGSLAWHGALFSALCAAASTGVTVITSATLLAPAQRRWLWGGLAGLAWAICPLVWSQAVITEVYTLHALLVALLGWVTLSNQRRTWQIALVVALGVAHHLTFGLLLPAAVYFLWLEHRKDATLRRLVLGLGAGMVLGALFYLRTPLVARLTPPINWGYADNIDGLTWLVTGAAYRQYLFANAPGAVLSRIAAWAYTLVAQFTPIGLALSLFGLSELDQRRPALRNFSLLWLAPVSIYAISYATRDSDLYLVPVAWLMSIWIALSLDACERWLAARTQRQRVPALAMALVLAIALIGLTAWRWPSQSLRSDSEAQRWVMAAVAELQPHSIVVSQADAETFALWYAAWGDRSLERSASDVVLLNHALYQFNWYRRLQADLHPDVAGIAESVQAVLEQNPQRPVYFSEQLPIVPPNTLTPTGVLWHYAPAQ